MIPQVTLYFPVPPMPSYMLEMVVLHCIVSVVDIIGTFREFSHKKRKTGRRIHFLADA